MNSNFCISDATCEGLLFCEGSVGCSADDEGAKKSLEGAGGSLEPCECVLTTGGFGFRCGLGLAAGGF